MTFQKTPKQKSNYPGLLETLEKRRHRDWLKAKLKVEPKTNLRSGFTPSARKVPN